MEIVKKDKLFDSLDGLCAFDSGCVDSGIKDESLRREVKEYISSLNVDDFRIIMTEFIRKYYVCEEAVEKGYDRISWTPGGANKTNPKVLGQTGEAAEASDRGLREFYDEIIPKKFEKISKQQVKEGLTNKHEAEFEDGKFTVKDSKQSVHYIDVPQSLKDTATQKGFPLFASGIPLTPVDHHPFVNNQNEVPYGAGASNTPSGYPVNIDKSIPQYDDRLKDKTGKPADLWKYLSIHEIAEHNAMEHNKTPYLKAHHDIATPAERAAVEADGVNWNEYEKIIDGHLKHTEHENSSDTPKNLYEKPYPHNKQLLMNKLKGSNR